MSDASTSTATSGPKHRLPNTTRVARQPVMVMGLNSTEFLIVIAIGFGSMILFTLLGWLVLGKAHYGMAFGFSAALLTAFIFKLIFVKYKRQKPDGYFQQILYRFQHQTIGNPELISHDGVWDAMRCFSQLEQK